MAIRCSCVGIASQFGSVICCEDLSISKDILGHGEDSVYTITINRLHRKNALTAAMYSELTSNLRIALEDSAIHSTVIQGHESVFCAGNDLEEFENSPPSGDNSPVAEFLRTLAEFSKPLVAAVCGPAVGVGTTMLLHCDLIYAGENAVFSVPFVKLGLCPEAASGLLLQQRVGYHRAAEAMLLGESFSANAALHVGLVNKVMPASEINAFANVQARRLGELPVTSLIESKRLMKEWQQSAVAKQMSAEENSFSHMLTGTAAKEAFAAFRAKRRPDFSKH